MATRRVLFVAAVLVIALAMAAEAATTVTNTAAVFWDGDGGSTFSSQASADLSVLSVLEVPTLGDFGLVALTILTGAASIRALRRGRSKH